LIVIINDRDGILRRGHRKQLTIILQAREKI
jgi:hypothetical protein